MNTTIVAWARRLDIAVAVICLLAALYYLLEHSHLKAGLWGASFLVGAFLVWLNPAERMVRRMFLARSRR